jgi:hypothetical protein
MMVNPPSRPPSYNVRQWPSSPLRSASHLDRSCANRAIPRLPNRRLISFVVGLVGSPIVTPWLIPQRHLLIVPVSGPGSLEQRAFNINLVPPQAVPLQAPFAPMRCTSTMALAEGAHCLDHEPPRLNLSLSTARYRQKFDQAGFVHQQGKWVFCSSHSVFFRQSCQYK